MRRFDGWRIRVDHQTIFSYARPVRASYNELRQSPYNGARQTVLDNRIHTIPGASQYAYSDYWGNHVVAFNVDGAHDRLEVRSLSLVETQPSREPAMGSWVEVERFAARHAELAAPTRFTAANPDLVAAALDLRRATPAETVGAVAAWVHESLRYEQGTTDVHTSAAEAFDAGSGVCQDFTHLTLSILRILGIPARYISGYLHPEPEAELASQTPGESHAWVEAWVGDWWGLDPSNDIEIGTRHVVVAHGRDYADVSPVRGIYAGDEEHSTSVTVLVTRIL